MAVDRAAVRRELLDRAAKSGQHILHETGVGALEVRDHDIEVGGYSRVVDEGEDLDRITVDVVEDASGYDLGSGSIEDVDIQIIRRPGGSGTYRSGGRVPLELHDKTLAIGQGDVLEHIRAGAGIEIVSGPAEEERGATSGRESARAESDTRSKRA